MVSRIHSPNMDWSAKRGAPATDRGLLDQLNYVEDRAGHDKRYAIDATKIETKLGWQADENFETGIVKTIEWYLNK